MYSNHLYYFVFSYLAFTGRILMSFKALCFRLQKRKFHQLPSQSLLTWLSLQYATIHYTLPSIFYLQCFISQYFTNNTLLTVPCRITYSTYYITTSIQHYTYSLVAISESMFRVKWIIRPRSTSVSSNLNATISSYAVTSGQYIY